VPPHTQQNKGKWLINQGCQVKKIKRPNFAISSFKKGQIKSQVSKFEFHKILPNFSIHTLVLSVLMPFFIRSLAFKNGNVANKASL